MSNIFTYAHGRTTRQVSEPPGGKSTISFGSDPPPPSPGPATAQLTPAKQEPIPEDTAAPADAVTVAPAETSEGAPEPEGPPLDVLKLQAIGGIATAKDDAAVREALTELIKKLQMAAASDVTPGASASRSVDAAAGAEQPAATFPELEAFKASLKLRGSHGIIAIGKKFRSMDDDNDRKISYDEFKKAAIEMKLGISEAEMTKLFRYFDRDASGYITFDELLTGLRGELNERRKDMVKRAFKILDKNGDGTVTLADLEGRYDASHHPDVVAGTKTPRQVLLEFLSVFESAGGGTSGDGEVSLEEFSLYYSMVSASVDDDDYFELMMRNVWHISGGEGWCANTTCKRVLVTHEDGTQEVVELTDDFDVDTKDLETVKRKLADQGYKNIKGVALYGDMTEANTANITTPTGQPPLSPSGAGPSTSSGRPITARARGQDQNRSSIVFG